MCCLRDKFLEGYYIHSMQGSIYSILSFHTVVYSLCNPFSCRGSKFTRMSAHPGVSFTRSLRSTASSTIHIWGKKLHVILHRKLVQGIFVWADIPDVVGTASYTILMPFRVLCVVRTWLGICWWFRCTLLFVALRVSSSCKHDMGTLLWLNTELLERVPTPPLRQICTVLCPLALFHETTVFQ